MNNRVALIEGEDLDAEMVAMVFDGRCDVDAWRSWGATDREIVDWQPHYDPVQAGACIGAGFPTPGTAGEVAGLCDADADIFAWGRLLAAGVTDLSGWMTFMPSPGQPLARDLARIWHAAGFDPQSAAVYLTAGVATPAEYEWWAERCGRRDPVLVGAALRSGWDHHGFESSFVTETSATRHAWPAMIEARAHGLCDPDRARVWRTAAHRCQEAFSPMGAAVFEQAGLNPDAVADVLTAVDVTADHHLPVLDWFTSPDPAAAAVAWADQWSDTPNASRWYAAGFNPRDAGLWSRVVSSDVDVCAFWADATAGTRYNPADWQVFCGSNQASRWLCRLAITRGKSPADVSSLLSPF